MKISEETKEYNKFEIYGSPSSPDYLQVNPLLQGTMTKTEFSVRLNSIFISNIFFERGAKRCSNSH
jgi:hypothetical protein